MLSKYMSSLLIPIAILLIYKGSVCREKPCLIIYEMNLCQIKHSDDYLHHLFGVKTNYCLSADLS